MVDTQTMHCNGCDRNLPLGNFGEGKLKCKTCVNRDIREKIQGVEVRETSSTGGQKGIKLERYDLIPVGPLEELARHYGQGAKKYENHQWRKGYKWTNSFSAMMRHAWDWLRGRDYDTCESSNYKGCSSVDSDGNEIDWGVPGRICYNHTGGHQMVCVAWHALTLLEFKETHIGHDDRYKGE